MDSHKIEKILAMKKYKRGTQEQNLILRVPTIVKYALTTLTLLLFASNPVWVPEILGHLRLVLYASLPNMFSFFLGPKFLFIVCNLIVVILVSESKFSQVPSARDMYEEELRKNLSYKMPRPSVAKVSVGGDEVREKEEDIFVGEVEEEGDVVELHKKVEDFIAKVKSQRRVEAKVFLCY
ncbi:hypothetical protein FCM35_KLT21727 [Carex littledalei]|uniref:DUF4408 domain-containing protein n=1 Tax=Carex littledalei TaxID=544730 RepID=A0A833QCD3_9POAL|nr:hypothetical protein FCM35_KLT21727 [Carex littledalei]